MGVLSNALKNGVVGEATRAAGDTQRTVAVVKSADESNNVCSVTYFDKDGKKREIKQAQVDLKNKDGFPKEKDSVLIDVSGSNSALILEQYTEDYNKDVKSKQQLKNDVSPDGDGTCCGQLF